MSEGGKKKGGMFLRLAVAGVIGFLVSFAPAKPAYAIPTCDTCASLAIATMATDIGTAIGLATTAISAAITLETTTLIAFLDNSLDIPWPVGVCPLVPTGSLDYDLLAGFENLQSSIQQHATNAVPMGAQPIVDSHKFVTGVAGVGEEAAKAVVPENSTHCATAYGLQARTQMTGPTRAITQMITAMVANAQDAMQGTTSGPGRAAQLVCESASFRVAGASPGDKPRNGTLAPLLQNCQDSQGNAQVPAPSVFADADLSPGSVFDPLQFTLPDKTQQHTAPNGHIEFFGLAAGPGSGADDSKWAFVAAWRFCEHLLPLNPPPPTSASGAVKVTLGDLERQVADMAGTATKAAAAQACMHAVAYRTACPATTQNDTSTTNATEPANCFQIQAAACHRIKDNSDPNPSSGAPGPSGMGISDIGNEEATAALANCATNGISQMMIDYIWAHRCGDNNYMSKVVPQKYGGDVAHVEQEEKACRIDLAAFESARRDEQRNYLVALDLLLQAPASSPTMDTNPLLQPIF